MSSKLTEDSFNNFVAKLGLGPQNLQSFGGYSASPFISRDRQLLESAYRSSWIVGQVVDTVAEDMTREGVTISTKISPDEIKQLQAAMTHLKIMPALADTIRWARLYGGAIAVILTEGADYSKPLNLEAISKNRFKGLLVLDRWMVEPSFGDLITEIGIDMGMPKYYTVVTGMPALSGQKIHYSRVIRFDGIILPYYQKMTENLWGLSVVERMFDRLIAYDSATAGASQLLHKAHLRTISVDGFRDALAMGGKTEGAVIKQFNYIRLLQTMEGLTVLDGKDQFQTHTYSFSGISDLLIQFGQQISGSTGIPLVRLFGQSPAGLSSTGESDLRNYYDHINKLQENQMRVPMQKILDVLCRSELCKELPKDLEFDFSPLWQLSNLEKSQVAASDVSAISSAYSSGIITKKIAMKELAENSRTTGRFTNISDEDIENAKEDAPGMAGEENPFEGMMGGEEGEEEENEHRDTLEDDASEKSSFGKKPPTPEDTEKILEDLKHRLEILGGVDFEKDSLEELKEKLRFLNEKETVEKMPAKDRAFFKDGFASKILKPLVALGIVWKIFGGGEKKLTAKERVERMMGKSSDEKPMTKKETLDAIKKEFEALRKTVDEQLKAPKGGVTIKGKFFEGGQFIPNEGGYAEAYKKMKEKEPQEIEKVSERSDGRGVVPTEKTKHIQKQFIVRTPQQNKHDVVTKLEKKTGIEYSIINNHVRFWAETSADKHPESLGLQFVAKDIFKVGAISHLNKSKAKKTEIKEKFIKAIYGETQEWFKEQGFEPDDEITLYRGVKDKIVDGEYSLQPLSSFSFSKNIAKGFAEGFAEGEDSGTTFVAKIPIKYVFSTPLTGIGCTDEYEVVVVGHDIDIHVVNDIAIHKNSDFKKVNKFDDVIIMPGFETLKGAPEIVGGDFNCSYNSLKSLEGAPKEVGGNFNCSFNKITSLKGAPKEVVGNFICADNDLTSLEGCPKEVGGNFICADNSLTSLKGCPKEVGGDFNCSYNSLKSLEGCPKEVGGDFDCSINDLTSLKGAPKEVGGDFNCSYNSLKSLEGCPKEVGGDFDCSANDLLKSLEGCPKEVVGNFNCSFNNLTSLEGAPEIVGGNFDCAFNKKLKSLEGCPKEVGGDFYYSGPFTEEDIRKVCNVKGRVMLKAE